jgi:hypothetical protein
MTKLGREKSKEGGYGSGDERRWEGIHDKIVGYH